MAADVAAERPRSTLTLGLEDQPPLPQAVALGAQHVLVSNVWLDPVFVAAAAGLAAPLAANVISGVIAGAIFIAAGVLFWFLIKAMARIQMPERPW